MNIKPRDKVRVTKPAKGCFFNVSEGDELYLKSISSRGGWHNFVKNYSDLDDDDAHFICLQEHEFEVIESGEPDNDVTLVWINKNICESQRFSCENDAIGFVKSTKDTLKLFMCESDMPRFYVVRHENSSIRLVK